MQSDERTRLLVDLEHSLKTPLLAAIRQSDAALERPQPNREDIVLIRALCARMWSQMSTFRTFAQLSSNEPVRPHLASLSITEILKIVQSAVRDTEVLDRHNNPHRFNIIAEKDDSVTVKVDLNLFEMALREVMDNAVKHSYRGTAVDVRVRNADKMVEISISNEGPPILPDEASRVLERGWRSAAAMRHSPEGSGLGLYLVNSVMQAQNGAVVIEPSERTMTVKLRLPSYRGSQDPA
jgi:two-component system sensor histidine kinase QseC